MPVYTVSGSMLIERERTVEAATPQDAVRRFERMTECRAEYVDEDGGPEASVLGQCEVCGGAILEGEEYHHDTEGVTWHEECPHSGAR